MHPDPEQIDDLVRRIRMAVEPVRIVLFGSAARGQMGPESDLDVLVIVRQGVHRRRTAQAIYERLIGLGASVDVVVATEEDIRRFGDVSGLVYYEALREGRAIYVA